jgi:hypothetical protein
MAPPTPTGVAQPSWNHFTFVLPRFSTFVFTHDSSPAGIGFRWSVTVTRIPSRVVVNLRSRPAGGVGSGTGGGGAKTHGSGVGCGVGGGGTDIVGVGAAVAMARGAGVALRVGASPHPTTMSTSPRHGATPRTSTSNHP